MQKKQLVRFLVSKIRKKSKLRRRSIYCIRDIKKGDEFSIENIKKLRPGYGIAPKYFPKLIGQKAKRNISKGDPITKLNSKIIL